MTNSVTQSMFDTMKLIQGHKNSEFENEQKRKKVKWEDEDRAHTMSEQARAIETRNLLEQAAAPADVEQVDIQGPPVGSEDLGTAPQVRGQAYVSMADATRAAQDYNAPKAQTARMADVLTRRAAPEAAAKLRTGQMNEEVAGLKLTGAQRDEAQAAYLEDLVKSVSPGNWDSAATFMNRSKAGGEQQGRFVTSPDGTKRIAQIQLPDGSWANGSEFDNTPEGFAELMMHLQRIPPDRMAAHFGQKDQRAEQRRYHDELLKDKDEAAAQRRSEFDARMSVLRLGRSGRGGVGGAGGDEAVPGDGRINLGAIDKNLEELAGGKDADGNPIKADPRLLMAVRALAARSVEAQGDDPRGAALAAWSVYQDALAKSGGNLDQAMQRVAIELDMRKTGTADATLKLGQGPMEKVGDPVAPQTARTEKAPPASMAMRELMAEEAKKREAKDAQKSEKKKAAEAEQAIANALTVEQIRAMTPAEAEKTRTLYGHLLPGAVLRILNEKALGAPLYRPTRPAAR